MFRRPAEEPAEGIQPRHPLQHRLPRTLPFPPALGHPQAEGQEGSLLARRFRPETLFQHLRLRERVPPPPEAEQQAGGAGRHGGVAR